MASTHHNPSKWHAWQNKVDQAFRRATGVELEPHMPLYVLQVLPNAVSSRWKTGFVVMAVMVQRRERMRNSGLWKHGGKKNLADVHISSLWIYNDDSDWVTIVLIVTMWYKTYFSWSWFIGCVYHNQTLMTFQIIPKKAEEEIIFYLPSKEPHTKHCYILIHNNWPCVNISFKVSWDKFDEPSNLFIVNRNPVGIN